MDNNASVRNQQPVFCAKCGSKLIENAAYCSMCGAPIRSVPVEEKADIDDCIKKLSKKEKISGIIWIVAGVFPIISDSLGRSGQLLVCIVWVIYGIARLMLSRKVQTPYTGMIQSYKNSWKRLLIGGICCLSIGGVVGLAGLVATIFEFDTRRYALENKDFLETKVSLEERSIEGS